MDLTEVEGLSDLLDADTALQRRQALAQMDGHMRKIFEAWRETLLRCLAHTEAGKQAAVLAYPSPPLNMLALNPYPYPNPNPNPNYHPNPNPLPK